MSNFSPNIKFSLALLLILSGALSAQTLSVTPSALNVGAASGSSSLSVSSNGGWIVSDNTNWVILNSSAGIGQTIIYLTYKANTSNVSSRTCEIKFLSGSNMQTVVLTQGSAEGTICIRPTNPITSNITTVKAKINWTAVAAATKYNYRAKISGTSDWTIMGNVSPAYKNISGLLPNTTYEWQVRSKCGTKASAYTAVATFMTDAAAQIIPNEETDFGLTGESSKAGLTLFPNPTDGDLQVTWSNLLDVSEAVIVISDPSGRELMCQLITTSDLQNRHWSLDTKSYLPGVYTLNLRTRTDVLSARFVRL